MVAAAVVAAAVITAAIIAAATRVRLALGAQRLGVQPVAPRMPTVEHDLPAGARRLKQTADGIMHTIVNGEVVLTNNEYSGATPGKLLRV